MAFSTLYSLSSAGKQKEWTISVTETLNKTAVITIVFGYTDGKKQTNVREIRNGKNIGRINETTPYQQAISDAESKWNKKYDDGYRPIEDFEKKSTHILPMLALDYTKRGHDIHFPCMVQPKVDGIRCVFDSGRFTSRKGKEFIHLNHIANELDGIRCILDGELYSYTLTFQEVSGLVRKVKLSDDDKHALLDIKFVVFDKISEKPFNQRLIDLKTLFGRRNLKHVELLETYICSTKDAVGLYLANFESRSYEGIILRNINGMYKQNYRSKDLQKLKTFRDTEYPVVGFSEGEGNEKGCVIWECETPGGLRFSVRPKGSREEREKMFLLGEQYIGRMLTVKFQELTTDGIPRFPVGIGIRDYE